MTSHWLGLPWPQVRDELESARIQYTLKRTCSPGRAPYGHDERVVRIVEDKGKLHVTICTFVTRVIDE